MIFHSLDFIAFFLVTLAAYWALPHRAQNVLLLVASYVFYGWVHPWWPVLLFVTTLVDYWAARRIAEYSRSHDLTTSRPRRKSAWLWLSIGANLGVLGFYKYFDFFVENVAAAGASIGWNIPPVALRLAECSSRSMRRRRRRSRRRNRSTCRSRARRDWRRY